MEKQTTVAMSQETKDDFNALRIKLKFKTMEGFLLHLFKTYCVKETLWGKE